MSAACDACLRRGALLRLLAPSIAGLLDRPRDRARGLLALDDLELIEAAAGESRGRALRLLDEFDAREARAELAAARVEAVCRHAPGYPRALTQLRDAPAVVFFRGRPARLAELLGEPAVAIVGARQASPYGLEVARAMGRGLSAAGVTVVSGLALGIDAAAHEGALEAGGRAIAVLACGPDVPYPRRHRELYAGISERGAVISELPPGTRPYRWSFPARNRIMAGLAKVVVVVEAAESSGSLITVDFAHDIGRDVAVVPGRVTSRVAAGSNRLLHAGAQAVRGAEDVLDIVFGVGGGARPPRPEEPRLDPGLRRVLDAVENGEDVGPACRMPAREARAALGRLELLGLVRSDGLGGYERTIRR